MVLLLVFVFVILYISLLKYCLLQIFLNADFNAEERFARRLAKVFN